MFCDITDFNFNQQIKLHLIYYACNVLRMECENSISFFDAYEKVKILLNDNALIKSFYDLEYGTSSLKLNIQLWLMKHRLITVLVMLIRR